MNKTLLKKLPVLFIFLNLSLHISFAQLPDGTQATNSFINILLSNLSKENALKFDTSSVDFSVNLSIVTYVVKDSSGNLNIDLPSVSQSIAVANSYFKYAGIKFSLKEINYVGDYHYSYLNLDKKPTELLVKHSTANTINLYLVDEIVIDTIPYYGVSYFPDDTLSYYIFLRKNFVSGSYLSCMLGHFFGLLSTHENKNGRELVSEANCSTTGDLICDTYADPNIFGLVDSKCLYSGTAKDPASHFYVPSVANLMSNAPGECRCIFTLQQYRRMFYYCKKFRQYLR